MQTILLGLGSQIRVVQEGGVSEKVRASYYRCDRATRLPTNL